MQIKTNNVQIKQWQGLHMYHSGFSTCSQAVRVSLGEKGVQWTGHLLDLKSNGHLTPEYISINPYGVVPTLVHDGAVLTDTLAVLRYLDESYPSPNFQPQDEVAQHWVDQWLIFKPQSKVLSFEFLFREAGRREPPHLEAYLATHPGDDYVQFQREFNSDDGLSRERVTRAVYTAHKILGEMNGRLADHDFLAGSELGLADILWIPKIHRLQWTNFPFDLYPAVYKWYQHMVTRVSVQEAILAYEPPRIRKMINEYSLNRNKEGTGITTFNVSEEMLLCAADKAPDYSHFPCGCG